MGPVKFEKIITLTLQEGQSFLQTPIGKTLIRALIALEGVNCLSVGWENGPERELKTVSFILKLPVIKQSMQTLIRCCILQCLIWISTVLPAGCLVQVLQITLFTQYSDVTATRIVRL